MALAALPRGGSRHLKMASQVGRFAVERNPRTDDWELLHLVTGERVALPPLPADWDYVVGHDENDIAFVSAVVMPDCEEADFDPFWAQDKLDRTVCLTDDGEEVLVARGCSQHESLADARRRYQHCQFGFAVGLTGADAKVSVFRFDYEVEGSHFWLSLPDLVATMRLRAKKAAAGPHRWLNNVIAAQERFLVSVWPAVAPLRRSMSHSAAASSNVLDSETFRVLRLPSIAAHACFALLARWAYCDKGTGGLGSDEDRARSLELLLSLLGRRRLPGDMFLHFAEVPRECEWRPPCRPVSGIPIRLHMPSSMVVDISPLVEACADGGIFSEWPHTGLYQNKFSSLVAASTEDGVHIGDLLRECVVDRRTLPIFGELCRELGWLFDATLGEEWAALQRGEVLPTDGDRLTVVKEDTGAMSRHELDGFLLRYMAASAREFGNERMISVAFDVSRVAGRSTLVCAASSPDGVLVWLAPQEVRDVRHPVADAIERKKPPAELAETKQSFLARCRAMVSTRKRAGVPKPKKTYRRKAEELGIALNNALVHSIGCSLGDWAMPEKVEDRGDPHDWPIITLAQDRGSDNMALTNYLLRQVIELDGKRLRLGVDMACDTSHGAWNDWELSVRAAGWMPHCLLMMLAMNCAHGPWSEQQRYQQVQQTMLDTFATMAPDEDPIFLSLTEAMVRDVGWEARAACDDDMEGILWRRLQASPSWLTKGPKISRVRFFAYLYRAESDDEWWHCRAYALLTTCQILGLMQKESLKEFKNTGGLASEGAAASSSSAPPSLQQDRMQAERLRAAATNQLELACLLHADPSNQDRQRCIITLTQPLKRWHVVQNQALRSTGGSLSWSIEQCSGGVWEHIRSTLAALVSQDKLDYMGFGADFSQNAIGSEGEAMAAFHDGLADECGTFVLSLVANRLRRILHLLTGWPFRACLLASDRHGDQALRELQEDEAAFHALSAVGGKAARVLQERSCFNLVSVQQLVGVARLNGWKLTPKLKDWAGRRSAKVISTQIDEDAFNYMKAACRKTANKFVRQEKAYAAPIKARVASERHHYTDVDMSGIILPRGSHVAETAFAGRLGARWLGLDGISSHRADPAWYSPAAARANDHIADLHLARFAEQHGMWHMLDALWLRCLINRPGIIVRDTTKRTMGGQWLWVLGECGQGCLVWPASKGEIQDVAYGVFWTFDLEASSEVRFAWVFDVDSWEGFVVQWRSPFSQWLQWHRVSPSVRADQTRIRAFAVTSVLPILELAASRCFYNLSRTTLMCLAKLRNIEIDGSSDLFEACWKLCHAVLGSKSEEDMLAILSLRKNATVPEGMLEQLLEVPDAVDLLTKDDQQEVKKMKGTAEQTEKKRKTFETKWREKRQQVSDGAARNGPKKRKTAARANPLGDWHGPERVPEDLGQPEAASMCPPKGYIWRNVRGQAWCGHQKPHHRRCSAQWRVHGQREAGLVVLRQLWSEFLGDHALPQTACPIVGLFSGEA